MNNQITRFGDVVQYPDFSTNRKIKEITNKVFSLFEKNGYLALDAPTVDFSEKFVLNKRYSDIQNLYKVIAGDGQVLAMPDDALKSLVNYLLENGKKVGRFCSQQEVFSFAKPTNPQNNKEICAVLVGTVVNETDAELCSLAIDIAEVLGIDPILTIGHTEIAQGILDTISRKNETKSRLLRIMDGEFENDADYACGQVLTKLKKISNGNIRSVLKDVSQQIDNQRSIDGLLNIFEVINFLEVEDKLDKICFSPLYLGENEYDNGTVLSIGGEKPVIFGGRLVCNNGQEDVYVSYLKMNMERVADICDRIDIQSDNKVTLLIAPTLTAFGKAQKLKTDFQNNGLDVSLVYHCNEETYNQFRSGSSGKNGTVVFVDDDGNIRHD